jgi:hypothetical protein
MPNRVVSVSALLLIAAAIGLAQQISGDISGSVRDTSGASVSAADVKLTSATTGAERQTRTDESGNFVFTSVSPGQYRLVAQAPGFKTAERKGVVLSAS